MGGRSSRHARTIETQTSTLNFPTQFQSNNNCLNYVSPQVSSHSIQSSRRSPTNLAPKSTTNKSFNIFRKSKSKKSAKLKKAEPCKCENRLNCSCNKSKRLPPPSLFPIPSSATVYGAGVGETKSFTVINSSDNETSKSNMTCNLKTKECHIDDGNKNNHNLGATCVHPSNAPQICGDTIQIQRSENKLRQSDLASSGFTDKGINARSTGYLAPSTNNHKLYNQSSSSKFEIQDNNKCNKHNSISRVNLTENNCCCKTLAEKQPLSVVMKSCGSANPCGGAGNTAGGATTLCGASKACGAAASPCGASKTGGAAASPCDGKAAAGAGAGVGVCASATDATYATDATDATGATGATGGSGCSNNFNLEQFQKECLCEHNRLRAVHGSPPLVLSNKLNKLACEWANHLAKTNSYAFNACNKYGENIYFSINIPTCNGIDITKSWYNEITRYDFEHHGFTPCTGHFTQVIWRNSRKFGVGACVRDNRTWVVAYYNPPGNIIEGFEENVRCPMQESSIMLSSTTSYSE